MRSCASWGCLREAARSGIAREGRCSAASRAVKPHQRARGRGRRGRRRAGVVRANARANSHGLGDAAPEQRGVCRGDVRQRSPAPVRVGVAVPRPLVVAVEAVAGFSKPHRARARASRGRRRIFRRVPYVLRRRPPMSLRVCARVMGSARDVRRVPYVRLRARVEVDHERRGSGSQRAPAHHEVGVSLPKSPDPYAPPLVRVMGSPLRCTAHRKYVEAPPAGAGVPPLGGAPRARASATATSRGPRGEQGVDHATEARHEGRCESHAPPETVTRHRGTHRPAVHCCSGRMQRFPQAPQLVGSSVMFMQMPPHRASPGGHPATQRAPSQVPSSPHERPQPPQLAVSVVRFTQRPPQMAPLPRWQHRPWRHCSPSAHMRPHPPHAVVSLRVSTSQPLAVLPSQLA